MKHISELSGLGEGQRCIIVGGGASVNTLEWEKLDDIYVICTNDHYSQMANMIIYYDKDMKEHFENHDIADNTVLIGFKHRENSINHTCERCDFFYNYSDMVFGDTGFHTLQFADKIFNFDDIYLVGLDYNHNGQSYHYDESVSDPEKLKKFEMWSIDIVLGKYKNMTWNHNIYNCSNTSALDMFKYAKPY
jgi:hypothetical protein